VYQERSDENSLLNLPRNAVLDRYELRPCVHLFVCLFVTSRYCTKMDKHKIMQTVPQGI